MTLATGFIIARFTIRGIKGRFFLWEETSITIAWICMIVVCSNNIVLTAPMNRVAALAREEVPYYQELLSDFQLAITRVFANGLVFWTCLWSVKIALMLQCKRLVERRPTYTLIWWCIVSFIILSYLGCYVVHFTICDNFKSMFNFRKSSMFPLMLNNAADGKSSWLHSGIIRTTQGDGVLLYIFGGYYYGPHE